MYTPFERRERLKQHGYNEAVIELVEYMPVDEIDHWVDHLLTSSEQAVQRMNYYRKKMKDAEEKVKIENDPPIPGIPRPQEIANSLSPAVVYYAAIRLGAHATVGKYSDTVVPGLYFMDALKRWTDDYKIEE